MRREDLGEPEAAWTIRRGSGVEGSTHEMWFSDEIAHLYEGPVSEFVDALLSSWPGVEDALHEDRELLHVRLARKADEPEFARSVDRWWEGRLAVIVDPPEGDDPHTWL